MKLDLDTIKETYAQMYDSEIEDLASQEAHELHPEVLEILIDEIKRRDLNLSLIDEVTNSTEPISEEEFLEFAKQIVHSSCPTCGEREEKLRAAYIRTVWSIGVMTSWKTKSVICCSACMKKKHIIAIVITALLGWWGFPWGIFKTSSALVDTYNDSI